MRHGLIGEEAVIAPRIGGKVLDLVEGLRLDVVLDLILRSFHARWFGIRLSAAVRPVTARSEVGPHLNLARGRGRAQ